MNFKEFFKMCEETDGPLGTVIPNSPFGAIPSNNGNQASGNQPTTRGDEQLGLPQVTFTSVIRNITGPGQQRPGQLNQDGIKKNVIHISFENGQNIFMSYDEFKRLTKGAKPGQTATVVLQRRSDDTSNLPSQVQSITVQQSMDTHAN